VNLIEELRQLDPRDVGRWPGVFRAAAVGLIFLVLTLLFVYLVPMRNQLPDLQDAQAKEVELMHTFDERQVKAANVDAYKTQLADMERSFGAMLRQLPGSTEVPSLLVDISQAGLASGLQEKLFQPGTEVRKEFYGELPIKIRLAGNYHQFGSFVSGIAALPRIVTLHDIVITQDARDTSGDKLILDVTAKTYRYLDDTETQAPVKPKQGGAG
jgi:type IV pilus assembly protein PilO